jgi:hypothetical protein
VNQQEKMNIEQSLKVLQKEHKQLTLEFQKKSHSQNKVNNELVKFETQLELIKDVILREKSF